MFNAVKKKNEVAYTTITVTMDRMHSKGLIEREIQVAYRKQGRESVEINGGSK